MAHKVPGDIDSVGEDHTVRRRLLWILLGGLVLRLVLGYVCPGYGPDVHTFKSWCLRITRVGPLEFLGGEWSRVSPGTIFPLYALVLWPLGWIWSLFDPTFVHWESPAFGLWIRLPGLLSDVVSFLAIYRIATLFGKPRESLEAAGLVYLSPALVFISAVWGHVDSLILAFLLSGAVALCQGRTSLGILLTGAAGLVRAQAFLFLPLALALAWRRRQIVPALRTVGILVVLALLLGALLLPGRAVQLYSQQFREFPVTTINAFNLWFPLGNWASDNDPLSSFLHLSRFHWGLVLFSLVLAFGAVKVATGHGDACYLREQGLVALGIFLLSTRVHERQLLHALAFLAFFPAYRRSYHLLTLTLSLNVLWVLGVHPAWGKAVEAGWGSFLAVVNLIVYLHLQFGTIGREEVAAPHRATPYSSTWPECGKPSRPYSEIVRLDGRDLILILVMTVAFGFLRFHHLANPSDLLFDEVYHAKSGQEIYQGKAPNEWVHPPLAKLLIGLGILKYGMNSFGWRFVPWVAGTLLLPFLYVLCRNILPDRRTAVVGTLLFALDGCYFVLSRTAMTNVFALFFQLATLVFFLLYLKQASNKDGRLGHGWYLMATSLAISLGVSTRWTCLWLLALVASLYGFHTVFVLKIHTQGSSSSRTALVFLMATLSGILHFILIPSCVYLASYYPLVAWNVYPDYHYVVSLQPQIWRFHTTFTTHHPYYSQWYTWCFTHRPVWYHYKDSGGVVTGIIALGNPFLWWLSVPAIIVSTILAARQKNPLVLFACFAWAGLYLPWILSPRVLNYSHYYTEPLPYACIALAWLGSLGLRWDRTFRTEYYVLIIAIAMCFAFFYPLYSATPMSRSGYDLRIWSKNWI